MNEIKNQISYFLCLDQWRSVQHEQWRKMGLRIILKLSGRNYKGTFRNSFFRNYRKTCLGQELQVLKIMNLLKNFVQELQGSRKSFYYWLCVGIIRVPLGIVSLDYYWQSLYTSLCRNYKGTFRICFQILLAILTNLPCVGIIRGPLGIVSLDTIGNPCKLALCRNYFLMVE